MAEQLLVAALGALVVSTVVLAIAAANMARLARQAGAQMRVSIDVGKKLLVLLDQVDVARVDVLQARVEELERQHVPTHEDRCSGVRDRASGRNPARPTLVARNAS